MRARPSLRAKRSNPEKRQWIASSLTLLAMTGRIPAQGVLRPSLRANGSRECAPDDRLREAIQSRKKGWIASSLTLLAMTGRIPAQGVLRPSLRAKGSRECAPDRHCERSEAIQSRKKGWIASSLTLLAMTGRIPAQGVLRPSLRANGLRECAPDRHCERSEAIQSRKKEWIASSLTLLAMTTNTT
jgi:hypothetical protein